MLLLLNHRSSGSPWPLWAGDAFHGHEIDHVFGVPFRDSRYNDSERTLSGRIITFWTNFAKTGYVREMSYRTLFEHSQFSHMLFTNVCRK